MQARMDADAEKRKGFTLAIEGDPIHLPLVYGFQKIGGVRTYHNTTTSRTILTQQDGFTRFRSGLIGDTKTSSTKDYLWIQQALCFGGIDSVIDIEVDGLSYDKSTFSHLMDISKDGGVANATATENGVPATNKFTNTAYLTGVFALNRDDPNYNGVPEVAAYVRGNKIHLINHSGGNYTLSATKTFSNNPALVLLDYLIRPKNLGGCGYDVSEINLKSFYDASVLCDAPVAEDVQVVGRINGVKPVPEGEEPTEVLRTIRLYECNLTLDTNETRRDNIERILETMAQSELIWSEGQYKLVLDYPTSLAAQNALITATYTDDDIVKQEIGITWAGVQDRFNRATVKFLNEEQDFATDSVSFPPYGSDLHQDYLDEDNGIENEVQYFLHGATHRRSALAKAEELVRNSRISKVLDLELNRRALVHEQGDLVKISSASAEIVDEVYRIEEMLITENLTVKMSLVRFDYQTLAYNVSDTLAVPPPVTLPAGIPNVENLTWNEGSRIGQLSNGWLSWDMPEDLSIRKFIIYIRPLSGQFTKIGETVTNYYDIPPELNDGTDYYFLIRSENNVGRLSSGVVVLLDALSQIVPISGILAQAGMNSVSLFWTDPSPELTLRYDIYQGSTNVRASAVKVSTTTSTNVTISPLTPANYYFWVDVVGLDGTIGALSTPVLVTEEQIGLKSTDFTDGIIGWDALNSEIQGYIDSAGDAAASAAAADAARVLAEAAFAAADDAVEEAEDAAAAALVSRNAAQSSATAAENSATSASGSASTATTQATLAGTRATAAQASATSAATDAGLASTSASQAAISASNALGSENSAATSAVTSASALATQQIAIASGAIAESW